jgi:hypothetical protein
MNPDRFTVKTQEALQAAGVRVGQNPTEAGTLMVEVVKNL